MVLQLAADDSERVLQLVVVDVHLGQARGGAARYPALVGIIVDHDRSPGRRYAHLTATTKKRTIRKAKGNEDIQPKC